MFGAYCLTPKVQVSKVQYIAPFQPSNLQRHIHPAQGHSFDRQVLFNAEGATFSAKSTLLNAPERSRRVTDDACCAEAYGQHAFTLKSRSITHQY